MESLSSKKRVRFDSDESESNSVKAKRVQDDILDVLEDSDIDSLMKSFENEISKIPASVAGRDSVPGEAQPDLGFLIEASDDDLGLPPTELTQIESEKIGVSAESVELGEVWVLDGSFDSFECEFGYAGGDCDFNNCNDDKYVKIDGLFDHTDIGF